MQAITRLSEAPATAEIWIKNNCDNETVFIVYFHSVYRRPSVPLENKNLFFQSAGDVIASASSQTCVAERFGPRWAQEEKLVQVKQPGEVQSEKREKTEPGRTLTSA